MKCQVWIVVLGALVSLTFGCGKSEDTGATARRDPAEANAASASQKPKTVETPPSSAMPAAIVASFFDALRDGNEAQIAALLTDKAREETAKSGLDIRSPGSASLSYQIGEFEFVTPEKDGAHVKSTWTEVDDQEQRVSTEVIWVLRKQGNGWRIAGMATQVAEGQLPLLFNFEDPEDMLRKKEYVEREHAATEEEAVQQAAKPASPAEPPTRLR